MRPVAFLLFLLGCPPGADPKDTGDTGDTGAPDTGDTADTADSGDTDTARTRLFEGFEATLDTSSACSDTWVQAWDADGSVGLEVYRAGILDAAVRAGAPVDETLTLGVDEVSVFVELADPVAINYCTDALSEREVHARYEAVSGTLTLHVEPPASEWGAGSVSLTLADVVFANDEGDTVPLATFTLTDVAVVTVWGG